MEIVKQIYLKRQFVVVMMACLITGTSCKQDRLSEVTTPNKISFESFESGKTKASVVTNTELSSMGIMGYLTGADNWATAAASATPNYFYNQEVTKSGATWSYSPEKYWPVAPNKISFFAYSPHTSTVSGGNLTISGQSATGAPTLGYTVPASSAQQIDLLFAAPKKDLTKTNQVVDFSMSHALTKVAFSAVLASGEASSSYKATIKEVVIKNALNSGTLDLEAGSWSTSGSTGNYTVSTGAELENNMFNTQTVADFTTRTMTASNGFLMLMPQTFSSATPKLSVTINFNSGSVDEDIVTEFDLKDLLINSSATWGMGKAVNYQFIIKYKNVTASAIDWTDAGQGASVFDGPNYLRISEKSISLGKWEKADTRVEIETNQANWSAKVVVGDPWLTLNNADGGGLVTGTADDNLGFKVTSHPITPSTPREGKIEITAGKMTLTMTVTQENVDLGFYLRLSTSELIIPGRVKKSGSWTAPGRANIGVAYNPPNKKYKMLTASYVGGGLQGWNIPTESDLAQINIDLDMISDTDPKVVADPFYERSSTIAITAEDEHGIETITKKILVRQIFYSLIVTQNYDYYFQGDTYPFVVRSNAKWIATVSDPNLILENVTGLSGIGSTAAAGETFSFNIKSDAQPDAAATVTFSNPNGLFDPVTYTIVAQDVLPNSYIVGTGQTFEFPVRKAYRVWAYDQDLYNHDGRKLDDLAGVRDVKLVWQDKQDLISSVSLVGSGDNAKISVVTGAGLKGNASISYTIGGDVYWTWHLWVTDFDPDQNPNIYNGLTIMDRNLGALSATPADNETVGLFYQGGRNIPLPSKTTIDGGTLKTIYGIDNSVKTINMVQADATKYFIPSIRQPETFIMASYDNISWYGQMIEFRKGLWEIIRKSDFDPCPKGWKIPAREIYTSIPDRILSYSSTIKGFQYEAGYFPAPGFINCSIGAISNQGTQHYMWVTPEVLNTGYGYPLGAGFRNTYQGLITASNTTAHAFQIRCVKQ